VNKGNDVSVQLLKLKEEIQNLIGIKVLYAADCQILSEQILNSTKRQISVSTLKRFFGIISSPFSPSKYTLDTLAIYLRYANYQEFINRVEKEKLLLPQEDSWNTLRTWTNLITNASLKSIRNKIGKRFESFPLRRFAENKVEDFLCSPNIATAFIAPNGYGKSTIVAQLTEKLFTGPDAKYPDDVVCLVDGSILYNLIYHYQKVNELYNLLEFIPTKSFSITFRDHPELVKGRFVLIIDGIDDIYPENEKIDNFANNLLNIIASYEHVGWFKLLITCSPNKWKMFAFRMQKNPLLKSFWFDVPFQGTDEETINIPLLKRKEIRSILKTNHFPQTLDDLCFNHPGILEIINSPYVLHLFLTTHKQSGAIHEIDLLSQYIKKMVLSSPYSDEKFLIIKSFFTLSEYGKKSAEVRKEDLILSPSLIIAYNELIKNDILYEYSIQDSYLTLNTYVKFSHNILFAYYLINILIKENGLNIDFLKSIITDYSNTPHLQCNILKYAIKILFREEQVELLKNIFNIIESDKLLGNLPHYNMPCSVLSNVLGVEMRKNPKLREILMPLYAQSAIGRTLYFERFFDIDCLVLHSGNDLDYYLKYNQSDEAIIYVRFMKYMQYFLSGNMEQCKIEYEKNSHLVLHSPQSSLKASFYFIPQILFHSENETSLLPGITEEVYRVSFRLLMDGIQKRIDVPQLEFAAIFSFNYAKMYKEIIAMADYIFDNYILKDMKGSCFYQLFLAIYAKSLFEVGEKDKAFEIYSQVSFRMVTISKNMKYYVRIRALIEKAQFQIYMQEYEKAKKTLCKVKEFSKMLKFSYFYESAMEMEKNILTLS